MEKNLQKSILVILLFFFVFITWRGTEAQSNTHSVSIPVEITIPAMLEMSLNTGDTTIEEKTLKQDLYIVLRSNSPWTASFQASSNLSKPPIIPPLLSGDANKDESFQVIPLELYQPLSWSDRGDYQLNISYLVQSTY